MHRTLLIIILSVSADVIEWSSALADRDARRGASRVVAQSARNASPAARSRPAEAPQIDAAPYQRPEKAAPAGRRADGFGPALGGSPIGRVHDIAPVTSRRPASPVAGSAAGFFCLRLVL